MRGAVCAHKAGAIQRKAHGEILDAHVMHDLIVAALQECRIDRAERAIALACKASGKRHRMLFGDAHIERARRVSLPKQIKPGASRHGGCHGDDAIIVRGFFHEAFGEHARIGWRICFGFGLRARHHIEHVHAVIFIGGSLGGRIALALFGDDVNQHRTGLLVAHVFQHGQKMIEVMAVDGADVIEAEFFKQSTAGKKAAREFFRAAGLLIKKLRQQRRQLLGCLADGTIGAARHEPRQIG